MSKKLFESYQDFCKRLIYWYQESHRKLPWRETTDPYKIWLSEIILQQTRVDQGLSYYVKFTAHYPTVFDLASASEEQVLRDWQGLGYYSRARNLHAAAKYIVDELDGVFPRTYEEVLKLKGVGEYTAAAIVSFAFGLPHAVLDGNVYRVLSRFFGVDSDISLNKTKKEFLRLANEVLDLDDPATYNQAIMEFGALQCTPKSPDCKKCPVIANCEAFRQDKVLQLPIKSKKVKVRDRYFNYLFITNETGIALQRRSKGDVWEGLFELPLHESQKLLDTEEIVRVLDQEVVSIKLMEEKKHVLSHQRIHCRFWAVSTPDIQGVEFYNRQEANRLPKSVLVNNFLTTFYF